MRRFAHHHMPEAERISLHDVALAAGVSLATVDRVLHGRSGVRARTVEHVRAVVERLGYRPYYPEEDKQFENTVAAFEKDSVIDVEYVY